MLDILDNLKKMKNDYDKMVAEGSRKGLQEVFQKFFTDNPEIKALYWTQYTPYWCDGDACVFGINEFSLNLSANPKFPEHYVDDEEGWFGEYNDPDKNDPNKAKIEDLIKKVDVFRKSFDDVDDIFLAAFGDHSSVLATPEGFEVESYEHG